jgi:hypothetical protein
MAIPFIKDIIDGVFGSVGDIVSEVVVDKDKRNEINANLERLRVETLDKADERAHEEIMGQLEINKTEATHSSIFVAGWRPFVGWVSGIGLGYGVIIEPLASWFARVIIDYQGPFPEIDPTLLIFALGGMLGIGTMRTVEKIKGVSSDTIQDAPSASRNVPIVPITKGQPENILPPLYLNNVELPEDAPWSR